MFPKITKPSIIIADIAFHDDIITFYEESGIVPLKVISPSEFISGHTFEVSKLARMRIAREYNFLDSDADEYLKIIKQIPLEEDLIEFPILNSIRTFLVENNLIAFREFESLLYQNKPIYLIGFSVIPSRLERTLKRYDDVIIISNDKPYKPSKLYEFKSEKDEAVFLAESISKLIHTGVSINHCFVHTRSSSFKNIVETIFDLYNLPIYIEKATSLYDIEWSKSFIKWLRDLETDSIREQLEEYFKKQITSSNHPRIKAIIRPWINILTPYINHHESIHDILDHIIYEAKKTSIKSPKRPNTIKIGDMTNQLLDENTHLFITGFNQGIVPKKHVNNRVVDDADLEALSLQTSLELTQEDSKKMMSLFKYEIEYVSYPLRSVTSDLSRSTLVLLHPDLFEMKKADDAIDANQNHVIHFSKDYDEIRLAKMIHDYNYFDVRNPLMSSFAAKNPQVLNRYKSFKPKDEPFNTKAIELIKRNVNRLSQNRINHFYECEFKYLLFDVIGLKDVEKDDISMFLGTYAHFIIEQIDATNNPLLHLERWTNDFLNQYERDFSKRDLFYLHFVKEQLEPVLSQTFNILKRTKFEIYRKEIWLQVSRKVDETSLTLVGKVDIVFNKDDRFFIVDYKSGSTAMKLDNLKYGLDVQLPAYASLVREQEPDLNTCVGLFYAPLIPGLPGSSVKNYKNHVKNELKWFGFLVESSLQDIDPHYQDDSFIKSIKVNKDGSLSESSKKKLMSLEHMEDILRHADLSIFHLTKHLNTGHFKVNPKQIGSNASTCQYCPFNDICYKQPHHILDVNTLPTLEELYPKNSIEGGQNDSK
jgi:ATP-dependent helicase/DNAse subunit B